MIVKNSKDIKFTKQRIKKVDSLFKSYVQNLTKLRGYNILAVDFDGTIVRHEYPDIGEVLPLAKEGLSIFQNQGWKIILNTMRSGEYLTQAVKLVESFGIELYGININPTQHGWTESTKCYAQLYIDDAALGCPLIYPSNDRPFVDWKTVISLMGWEKELKEFKKLN